MLISAIVAVANNGVIGKGQQLPWRLPAEMAIFKKLTTGHHILCGRRTAESLGRALPSRINMVLSCHDQPKLRQWGMILYPSIQAALEVAVQANEQELFIIGGAELYLSSFRYWNRLYLSQIEADLEGDSYFPICVQQQQLIWRGEGRFSTQRLIAWQCSQREQYPADASNSHSFVHSCWNNNASVEYQ